MAYVNANNNNKVQQRTNEMIRVREVRLIDDEGNQLGIVPTQEALRMAKDKDLDLVEVSPNANPPVCKILDFGKYRFEQEKKLRESKKNQKVLKLKEIRMQPKIGSGDLDTKAKHVQEFLNEGDKVKITVRFRGRELAHTELGFPKTGLIWILEAVVLMILQERFLCHLQSHRSNKNLLQQLIARIN